MTEPLIETHIHGEDTEFRVVRATTNDKRPWLKGAPVCQALSAHQIVHAGVMIAREPYRIVRQHQSGVYFLACVGGEGRVLVDGRWQRCAKGMAVALPAFMANAFHAVKGSDWRCCWVRYEQQPEQRPILSSSSPVMARFDGGPLSHAISSVKRSSAPGSSTAWYDARTPSISRGAGSNSRRVRRSTPSSPR